MGEFLSCDSESLWRPGESLLCSGGAKKETLGMSLGVTFGARAREDDQGLEVGMRHRGRRGSRGRLKRHPG